MSDVIEITPTSTQTTERAFGHNVPVLGNPGRQESRQEVHHVRTLHQDNEEHRQYNVRPDDYEAVRRAREQIEDIRNTRDSTERDNKRNEYAQEMLRKLQEDKAIADRITQEMLQRISEDPKTRVANVVLSTADARDARQLQGDTIAALEMVREGVLNPPDRSKILLTELSQAVNNGDIPPNEMILLNPLVSRFATEDITFSGEGADKTDFERMYDILAGLGTESATWILRTIQDHPETFNITPEKLDELNRARLEQAILTELHPGRTGEYTSEEDMRYFDRYFGGDKDALRVLRAISSPQEFINYYNEKAGPLKDKQGVIIKDQDGNPRYPESADVSKEIMDEVRLTFNKLTRQTYHKRPTAIFAEEIRKGFPDNIESAITKFTLKITNLVDHINEHLRDHSEDKIMTMQASAVKKGVYYVQTKRKIDEKYRDVDKTDRVFLDERRNYMHSAMSNYTVIPTHKLENVTMREFLEGLELAVDTEFEMTEYFYNIQTITARGGHGEGGHWDSIKQYAEHLNALSLDTLPLIVDSEMIMSARRLYLKFLRAQFASYNWIHSPGMFMSDFFSNKSDTLRAVTEQLKIMYPEIANSPEDAWRIDQAMSKAIGISFGLTLDEPETAAWADAPIVVRNVSDRFEEAMATAQSFYRGDSRILAAFDPWIDILRFHGEDQSIGPLVYAMLKDPINKKGKPFDHRELWENMLRFKEAFRQGRMTVEDLGDEAYMAMNQMKNFFEIGSIFYRGGWRDAKAVDGWIQKTVEGYYADINQAWNSVKYIGSQVGMRIISGGDFNKALNNADETTRKAFLEGLYKDYIVPIEGEKNFDQYMADMLDTVKEYDGLLSKYGLTEDNLYNSAELQRVREKSGINEDLFNKDIRRLRDLKPDAKALRRGSPEAARSILLNRAIAAQMMRWAPTRFLTLERNRMTTDGARMYERVRQAVFDVDNPEYEKKLKELEKIQDPDERKKKEEELAGIRTKEKSVDEMDQALRDIMVVEERLREETSKKMRDHLEKQRKAAMGHGETPNLRLDDLGADRSLHDAYHVNEKTIEDKLREIYLDSKVLHTIPKDEQEHYRSKIEERIDKAKQVYMKTMDLYRRDGYIAARGTDLRENKYRITLGNDDLDWEFMAYRNAGERPHGRAIGDMARAEKAGHLISEFEKALQQIAANPEKPDDSALIQLIEEVHNTVKSTHSFDKAGEKSYLLAKLASLYFRHDADTEKWWKGFGGTKLHSIAAEFAGTNHVFDWDAVTNHQFLERLKVRRLLRPNRTYNDTAMSDPRRSPGEKHSQPGKTRNYEEWSAEKLEQEMAAHRQNIILRFAHTYGPAAILVLSFLYLRHAIKEEEESRR